MYYVRQHVPERGRPPAALLPVTLGVRRLPRALRGRWYSRGRRGQGVDWEKDLVEPMPRLRSGLSEYTQPAGTHEGSQFR